MNIYELTAEYMALQEAFEMQDDDTVAALLADTDKAIENKADGYAKVIKNFEADIEGLKAEIRRLSDKKAVLENAIQRLKDTLKQAMVITGKTKFKTQLFSFGIQKNGGAAPIYLRVPEEQIPDEFMKITRTPDKKAMADYIMETGDVTLFNFGERGESLRIR